jgi:hypothetical protein
MCCHWDVLSSSSSNINCAKGDTSAARELFLLSTTQVPVAGADCMPTIACSLPASTTAASSWVKASCCYCMPSVWLAPCRSTLEATANYRHLLQLDGRACGALGVPESPMYCSTAVPGPRALSVKAWQATARLQAFRPDCATQKHRKGKTSLILCTLRHHAANLIQGFSAEVWL